MFRNKKGSLLAVAVSLSLYMIATSNVAEASYSIYIGKNLTVNGTVLIGGSGDEVSSHWLR